MVSKVCVSTAGVISEFEAIEFMYVEVPKRYIQSITEYVDEETGEKILKITVRPVIKTKW